MKEFTPFVSNDVLFSKSNSAGDNEMRESAERKIQWGRKQARSTRSSVVWPSEKLATATATGA